MKYWFDTEFIERGPDYPVQLLSIGILAEDGRELYAEAAWTDRSLANEWVQANVIPYLHQCNDSSIATTCPLMSREVMRQKIQTFCDPEQYGKPEFWAYFADYDWVVLAQLFGTMMDLPAGWPMFCHDIIQESDRIERFIRRLTSNKTYKLKLPEQGKGEHHARADARWNKRAYDHLQTMLVHLVQVEEELFKASLVNLLSL